ncbi:restriction endonuclease [Bacillus toyonensis]|uniref:restriction endonuclease subunit S n=1 Tax=Bacillus toyonensis TaxID=155322 RepID=UPI00163B3E2F|nr:restriction endonuclease subunit S [Bacillus toyonensis]MBC2683858.1 restriction endonuclease [Bacillus toyonensis]
MSKKKKTIEELVYESLVVNEEQPYDVPENWIWIKLKGLNKNEKRNIEPKNFSDEIFELYSVPSYTDRSPEFLTGEEIGSNKQLVKSNEILLCKINPRINRVWKVSDNKKKYRQLASTEWIVINENRGIYPNYLFYLFGSPYFRKLISSNVSGVGGSLTRARPREVENYPIAIPPLNEQKRIAEKVECFLNKIEEAKELVKEAKETFEVRRAAILDKAFRGELTAKWREENLESSLVSSEKIIVKDHITKSIKKSSSISETNIPISWEWILSNDLFSFVTSGSRGWAKYYNDVGDLFIRVGNLSHQSIDIDMTNQQKVNLPKDTEGTRTLVQENDILVSITADIGRIAVIPKEFPKAYINQHIALARPVNGYLSEYLAWYLSSRNGGRLQFDRLQRGATKAGLGLNDIKNVWVPVPSLEEQHVIVCKIESAFNKLDKVEKNLKNTLEICEKLKNSILVKAFRGELGTNDSAEENVIELLKELYQEQAK